MNNVASTFSYLRNLTSTIVFFLKIYTYSSDLRTDISGANMPLNSRLSLLKIK